MCYSEVINLEEKNARSLRLLAINSINVAEQVLNNCEGGISCFSKNYVNSSFDNLRHS